MIASERIKNNSSPEPNTGCWIWTGAAHGKGYGHIWYKGGCTKAHRASYEEFVGEIPEDKVVMHKCDNPACVNPDHLSLGSNQENMDDRNLKRRQAHGESHSRARLKSADVLFIRNSDMDRHSLAKMFEISYPTVCNIQAKRIWKHI